MITVTRVTREKGVLDLLKTAELVHQVRPSVRFLIVGPRESEGPFAVTDASKTNRRSGPQGKNHRLGRGPEDLHYLIGDLLVVLLLRDLRGRGRHRFRVAYAQDEAFGGYFPTRSNRWRRWARTLSSSPRCATRPCPRASAW